MTRLSHARRGISEQRHATAAHAEDGSDDIGGSGDGAEAADHDAQNPIISAVPFRECLAGERSISEPADIRSAPGASHSFAANETEVEQQSAKHTQPEAERVEPREGQVARADHQRHKIIREAEDYRHPDQKYHRRAVHGEQLIEHLRR